MTAGLSSPEPEDGGAVNAESVAVPAESVAGGPTGSNADGKANDGREALRGDLARLIDKVGLTPFEPEGWRLDELAGRLLTAGWRRVVEDDDTIERLAAVLAKADGWFPWDQPADVEQESRGRRRRQGRLPVHGEGCGSGSPSGDEQAYERRRLRPAGTRQRRRSGQGERHRRCLLPSLHREDRFVCPLRCP